LKSRSLDVAIVGAGLIGLATAFELAQRGANVRVCDYAEPGRAASWAGAGMLAPHTEHLEDEAMLALCERSLERYPGFCERVSAASGVDPQLHLEGIVHAAFDAERLDALHRRSAQLQARGVDCRLLERRAIVALEPWLGAAVRGGLLVSGEGHVDNRRLGRALVAGCQALGVRVVQTGELHVECDARRVLGIRTDVGFTAVDAVVNACGAWASQLSGIPSTARPPVFAVKGQMLALEVPVGFVRHPTWLPAAYVVPRDDGRLLVGATAEPDQFDTRVTASGLRHLLDAALLHAPSLGEFTVSETWAGIRPGTSDGKPFLGSTSVEGLFVATGHYRNGILLAPATAWLIAESIEGRNPPELAAFSLARVERKPLPRGEMTCS